ncbi:hypothetical protein SLA2020_040960 [Shorea laevis]
MNSSAVSYGLKLVKVSHAIRLGKKSGNPEVKANTEQLSASAAMMFEVSLCMPMKDALNRSILIIFCRGTGSISMLFSKSPSLPTLSHLDVPEVLSTSTMVRRTFSLGLNTIFGSKILYHICHSSSTTEE